MGRVDFSHKDIIAFTKLHEDRQVEVKIGMFGARRFSYKGADGISYKETFSLNDVWNRIKEKSKDTENPPSLDTLKKALESLKALDQKANAELSRRPIAKFFRFIPTLLGINSFNRKEVEKELDKVEKTIAEEEAKKTKPQQFTEEQQKMKERSDKIEEELIKSDKDYYKENSKSIINPEKSVDEKKASE